MLKRAMVVALLLNTNVRAADVNVTGKVIASACTVSAELSGGQTVRLGTLGRTKFQLAGNADPKWHNFLLVLRNCPEGTNSSTATFTGTPDSTDGTLFANTEPWITAATNMAVQISKQSDNKSIISNGSKMTEEVNTGDDSVVFQLAARMFTPVGNVQAGKVSATVLVDFTYQ